MSIEVLESLINQDFGYSHSGRWGKSDRHSSFVVDRDSETWFWNSKGLRGKLVDYLRLIRNYSEEQIKDFLNNLYSVPSETADNFTSKPYEKLVEYLWLNGRSNRDYWYSRGLNDEVIDRFKLGFSDEWYTIPFYESGEFKNFQCRKDLPEKKIRPWYRGIGPLLFNGDILRFVSTVYITEGPVDAILLNQYGFPAISHSGGAQGWNQIWFKHFIQVKDIIYIADNDLAGIQGSKKVAKSLGETRTRIYRFSDRAEKYDTVDFFRDGGSKEEFIERISTGSKYLYEGL
jgi:hypothetical protein